MGGEGEETDEGKDAQKEGNSGSDDDREKDAAVVVQELVLTP